MFQDYLIKQHTPKVAKGYIKDYLDFEAYLREKSLNAENTTEIDVKEYIQWLRGKNLTNRTISKKLSLIRKFYKWLRKEGLMVHNPMDDIQQPKIIDDKKEVTKQDRELLKSLVTKKNILRDRIIFQLLMDEGIKPSEMIKITFKDCDLEKRMIMLDAKKVIIGEETATFITHLKMDKEEGFLLTNQHGHPLKESGIYFVIKNYLTAALDTAHIKPGDLIIKKEA